MASSAAKRYTDAVFGIAREKGTFDQWQNDLDALSELVSDSEAARLLESPKVAQAQKSAVVDQVLQNAQPEAKNLARLLLERNRLHIATEMSELFREQALAELGIVVADVTTAVPIDKSAEQAISQRLSSIVGKQVQIRTHVDESIIGGIVARIGDQLIDGSVNSQLKRLRTRLETGV
jgi:F-type H+-transporting ATPase subunit delta